MKNKKRIIVLKKMNFFATIRRAFYAIDKRERRMTTATFFTILRIILTPIIVALMIMGSWGWACGLFLCAALTDMIDGLCARYLNQQTFLGACLDPVADKFLMISCFFTLWYINTPFFHIPQWFIIAILTKEVVQIVAVGWLWLYCECQSIEATFLGKATMALQVAFIGVLFSCYFFNCQFFIKSYNFMLAALCVVMCLSFVHYVLIGIRIAKKR